MRLNEIILSPSGVGVNKNPPRWRRVALYFYEFVYTLAPPPCSAGIIMTTTTTINTAILVTLCSLLINIKIECTVNVHLHFEINKELFYPCPLKGNFSNRGTVYIIVDFLNSILPLFTLSGILSAT